MAKAVGTHWAPKGNSEKTSVGQGGNTKYKSLGSDNAWAEGHKKKYRGQGKG